VFVSARISMAIMGIACVGLTYLLGTRLFGSTVGLLAALLLALNSLHIGWSQVVRTDICSQRQQLWLSPHRQRHEITALTSASRRECSCPKSPTSTGEGLR
jgi:hypothetical protein